MPTNPTITQRVVDTRFPATDRMSARCAPLTVALDATRARLDAALDDLLALVAGGELGADDAGGLEREYVARHLRRIADLEQRGALACTPDE